MNDPPLLFLHPLVLTTKSKLHRAHVNNFLKYPLNFNSQNSNCHMKPFGVNRGAMHHEVFCCFTAGWQSMRNASCSCTTSRWTNTPVRWSSPAVSWLHRVNHALPCLSVCLKCVYSRQQICFGVSLSGCLFFLFLRASEYAYRCLSRRATAACELLVLEKQTCWSGRSRDRAVGKSRISCCHTGCNWRLFISD